jgi:hypothetical protein
VKAAARIPGARLITIEGAEHSMLVTRAPELRGHIRQFLAGLPGAKRN